LKRFNKLIDSIGSKDAKAVISNMAYLSILKGVDFMAPLVVLPYIIKTVGVYNYGIYAFVYSAVFYMLYISQYGFSLSAVREIALQREDSKKTNDVFNEVMYSKGVIVVCCVVLLGIMLTLISDLRSNSFLLVTTAFIIIGDALNPTWLYQGMERMKYMTLINFVTKMSFLVLVFIFIKKESDYVFLGLCQSIGYILSGALSLWLALRMFNLKFKVVPFKSIASKLKHGSSAFITLTVPLLYVNTSTFMLGIYGNPVHVAYFDCAYKVSNGFISINQILTSVFYPWVSRQAEKFSFIASVLICVGLAMSIISFSVSSLVVNLIFGEKMVGSIIALKILSLSPLFIAIRSAFGVNYLLARGKDKLYMSIAAISSIVSFLGGIILINLYSSVGAAIVVVVAQGMYSLASMFFALKLMKKQDD